MTQQIILNFNGADGSTDFNDEVAGLTPSWRDNAEIDTSWFKYGSGSLLLGAISSLSAQVYYEGLLAACGGDVTLHFWGRPEISGAWFVAVSSDAYDRYVMLGVDDEDPADPGVWKSYLAYQNADGSVSGKVYLASAASFTDHHLAAVVKNSDLMAFVDGFKLATIDLSIAAPLAGVNTLAFQSTLGAQCHLDAVEVAYSALWTSDFTPPGPPASRVVPCAQLDIIAHAPSYNVYAVPAAVLSMTAVAPYRHKEIPAASFTLESHVPLFGSGPYPVPVAALIAAGINPAYIWTPSVSNRYKMQTIYQCILTGSTDGLDDLVIPISSFQSTLRDGDPSYLACVIPGSVDWIADIQARTNGEIIVKKGVKYHDGTINAEEICRVDYESLQLNRGGRSDSATLSGHKTVSAGTAKIRALSEVSYYGIQADGKRVFRAAPDLFLRVGDQATYNGQMIVVGQIQHMVNATMAMMQVTEA